MIATLAYVIGMFFSHFTPGNPDEKSPCTTVEDAAVSAEAVESFNNQKQYNLGSGPKRSKGACRLSRG